MSVNRPLRLNGPDILDWGMYCPDVMILNSGIGGSLDKTRLRLRMSDWAVETSKTQESLLTLRDGMKVARRKAGSDREDTKNTPEVNCERVMP